MSDARAEGLPERADVVIVGAGLAGLACARAVAASGRSVCVLEASDGAGGRVRTDLVDGFRLDRGFQVLLTAYPEVARQLDVPALRLRAFDPGALVWTADGGHRVGDPFRQPTTAWATARAPIGTLADKARIVRLRRRVRDGDGSQLLRQLDVPAIAALRAQGFSPRIIDRFFRPLFGGILLDPSLTTSRRMFDVLFRSLSEGSAAVPAEGMGAIPAQLAEGLPAGTVVLGAPVRALDGTTAVLADGRRVSGDAIVVATDGPAAVSLLGLPAVGSQPVAAVWFAAPTPPVPDRLVVLDATGTGPALNVAVMSNVAPEYAPSGQSLVVAACPGPATTTATATADLAGAVQRQLRGWWGPSVDAWRVLRTDVIAHGQPDQHPPFAPKQRVALGEGRFVCGDHRDTASIQGALHSGRRCGEAVVTSLASLTPA